MLIIEQTPIIHNIFENAGFIRRAWMQIRDVYEKDQEFPDGNIIIRFEKVPGSRYGLIRLSSLIEEIEDALGRKVDLVERKPMLKDARLDSDNNQYELIFDLDYEAKFQQVKNILKDMVENKGIDPLVPFDNRAFNTFLIYMLEGCQLKAEINGNASYSNEDYDVILAFARTMVLLLMHRDSEEWIENNKIRAFLWQFIDTYTQMQEQNVSQ